MRFELPNGHLKVCTCTYMCNTCRFIFFFSLTQPHFFEDYNPKKRRNKNRHLRSNQIFNQQTPSFNSNFLIFFYKKTKGAYIRTALGQFSFCKYSPTPHPQPFISPSPPPPTPNPKSPLKTNKYPLPP